jgi:hypothetical protein
MERRHQKREAADFGLLDDQLNLGDDRDFHPHRVMIAPFELGEPGTASALRTDQEGNGCTRMP